ncbi:MAG: DNA-directed RNA polymerase subunit beta [Lactobacillus sp.]|uniref:DNA-directed RNA polymerase subunit beta n=1 Tax=Bombilactobacillus bombi TaxID=1303590 RepID=A0A347SRL8_9LACO|nr:DNA-directed RNA polymerase subunit beta [Bombilactobacillus bombi]AXX64677.1 DNA-directed RNA polymerase subunit beta [Bombilactobacillus bombi]MCO6542752.1 DNA-directed RNA polymerase subunit beta [Lactobacillus sp.]RHW46852.1 DNA-directed RNA polymerase subunit beta [Bombilactobacillus bombi]RHW49998.1 DNA-directed RNA polymerase subunit beta [Bombilactobacillus bombi]
MNKSHGNKLLKTIALIILAVLILFVLGAMIGAVIGGGNILTPLMPSTWSHILQFSR